MKLQALFTATVLTLVAVAAHAAPQEVKTLPRVVITGKASTTVAEVKQLPRVVIVGQAVRDTQVAEVKQLPSVVVVGYSQATLARQTLAAAKPAVRNI